MRHSGKKSYRTRLLLWIGGGFLTLVLALAAVLLSNTERLALAQQRKNDGIVLAQLNHYIQSMHASFTNFCSMLYNSPSVIALMYDRDVESDFGAMAVKMHILNRSIILTSPFVHSVFIYNHFTGNYYSSYRGLLFRDMSLESFVDASGRLPKLTPVYRRVDEPGLTGEFLTYFQYDRMIGRRMDGGIAVNVQTKWLLDNLRAVNQAHEEAAGYVFLVTQDGKFLHDPSADAALMGALDAYYAKAKADMAENGIGFHETRLLGRDYILSTVAVPQTGFRLLRVVERGEVELFVRSLRASILLITAGFVVLSILAALLLSKRMYRPVDKLVGRVSGETTPIGDEFTYLDQVFKDRAEKLNRYESERRGTRRLVKNTWLTRLLSGQETTGEDAFQSAAQEYRLSLLPGMRFSVLLVLIDAGPNALPMREALDRDLLMFAVLNIASEVVAAKIPNEAVELPDHLGALILGSSEEIPEEALVPLIREAMESVQRYLSLSVSASLAGWGALSELPQRYAQARQDADYRFADGYGCLITESRAGGQPSASVDYAFPQEKRLVEAIRLGKPEGYSAALNQILEQIRALPYSGMMISLFHLSDTIRQTLWEIARTGGPAQASAPGVTFGSPLQFETLADYREALLQSISAFFEKNAAQSVPQKHAAMVEAVRAAVLARYAEDDLCLASLSEMARVSSKHLSRIFKEQAGESLPDFIAAVRMQKAAELLTTTDLSVGKIAAKVGILNETYLYSMFKRQYGVSPGQYKTAHALNKAR